MLTLCFEPVPISEPLGLVFLHDGRVCPLEAGAPTSGDLAVGGPAERGWLACPVASGRGAVCDPVPKGLAFVARPALTCLTAMDVVLPGFPQRPSFSDVFLAEPGQSRTNPRPCPDHPSEWPHLVIPAAGSPGSQIGTALLGPRAVAHQITEAATKLSDVFFAAALLGDGQHHLGEVHVCLPLLYRRWFLGIKQ